MISDSLEEKFDSVEDLPVSEEMYGAYLEHNLSPEEMRVVEDAIADSDLMAALHTELSEDFDDLSGDLDSLPEATVGDPDLDDDDDIPETDAETGDLTGDFGEAEVSDDFIADISDTPDTDADPAPDDTDFFLSV